MKQRQVKYRGLRTDTKKFVYGVPVSLIEENKDNGIIDGISGSFESYDIIEESLGEYTGLLDKNKTEIYESDILTDGQKLWIVLWHTQGAKWWMKRIEDNSKSGDDYILEIIDNYDLGNGYYSRKDLEIIGNVHENPELLDVERKQ